MLIVSATWPLQEGNNVMFQGTIIDYQTNTGIANVAIRLIDITNKEGKVLDKTKSDENGSFVFENVPNIGTCIELNHSKYMPLRHYGYGGQFQTSKNDTMLLRTINYATINIDSLAPYLLGMNIKAAIKLAHFNETRLVSSSVASFSLGTDGCTQGGYTVSQCGSTADSTSVILTLEETDTIQYDKKTVQCVIWSNRNTGVNNSIGNCKK